MAIRALIFDSVSINRFLSGFALPADWHRSLQLGDDESPIRTFYINNFSYALSEGSNKENPRLIIKLGENKLFSGFSDETDRIEALHRCVSAAQRFFEGKVPAPLNWKSFSKDDIKSFQSNNRTSGETRRIVAKFSTTEPVKIVYVFDLTSRQVEFDTMSVDRETLTEANINFDEAVTEAKAHFSSLQTAVADIPLRELILPSIPATTSFDDIYKSYLTDQQRRFVDFPLSPIRLSGAAGTGKTFAMVYKLMREIYRRAESGEKFRFMFLTHNTTARDLVDAYVLHLSDAKRLPVLTDDRFLSTDTLLNLAYRYLSAELSDIEPISIDAHVGKGLQLDFLSDIVIEYRRGLWLTKRNNASNQMKNWMIAEKGSVAHRNFCWDLMNEIACALDAENVREVPERRQRYVSSARSRSVMRLETGADREVVLDIYDRFREVLKQFGVISTDQLMLDFAGYLDSFRWDIKRAKEGFDAIFVDEFHLFNAVERGVFLPLLKKSEGPPALLMAYDTRQSPREAFLGLVSEGYETPSSKFSVAKAEKFELTDVFRYTPEIAALLRFVNNNNPIDGLDPDWVPREPVSRLKSGDKPESKEFASTEEMYDFVFDYVRREVVKKASLRSIAVLSVDYAVFDQIKKAGKYSDKIFVIDSREDLLKLQYAGRRVIFSAPEYVSGFQFDAVLVCDVNARDAASGRRTTWQERRFNSLLYLGASRARYNLFLFADKKYGGLAEVAQQAVSSGILGIMNR